MTAFLVSKVQQERELAHLCGIRPCDARKSMRPCRLSPSIAPRRDTLTSPFYRDIHEHKLG